MKFTRIFKEAKLFWPSEIEIADGKLIENEGAMFPALSRAWDEAEKCASKVNGWHELMSWSIFCGFHKIAQDRLKAGDAQLIKMSDLDLSYVQHEFSESLNDEDAAWPKQIRRQYVNDRKS